MLLHVTLKAAPPAAQQKKKKEGPAATAAFCPSFQRTDPLDGKLNPTTYACLILDIIAIDRLCRVYLVLIFGTTLLSYDWSLPLLVPPLAIR